MIGQVLRRADDVAQRGGGRITGISLRVGAAAGLDATSVRRHAEIAAEERWGFRPAFDVEVGREAPGDPAEHGLTLVSVRLEG
jgi:hypothetical protein